MPRNGKNYKTLNTEITNTWKQAEMRLLNEKLAEIQSMSIIAKASIHKAKITQQQMCSSIGCIHSNKGILIIEKVKVFQRWSEYVRQLFHDSKEKLEIHKKILKDRNLTVWC